MKKIFFIISGTLLAFSWQSCKKDFLSTSSPSEYTPEVVYSSVAYTNFALTGIYALLTQDQLYSARLPLNYATNTDVEIVGANATSYRENTNRGLSNYLGTPDNSSIQREWTTIYKMIERANLAIEGIRQSPLMGTVDSNRMKGFLGEALTLRALGYFELVKNWGDIPFKTESTKYDLSNVYLPPTDRDSIMEVLIDDLQEASVYVPWVKSSNYASTEKVTKGFIKGLIARIALTRGGYSIRNKSGFPTERGADWQTYYAIAREACLYIINNGTHTLNSSYASIWQKLCNHELDATFNEPLFEVANGLGRSGEMGYSIGIRFYANAKYGFGNNANVVNTTAYYFYSFDQKDLRRDETVAYFMYGNSAGDAREVFQTNPLSYNFTKWDQRKMNSTWLNMNLNANGKFGYGINWVIMRYADVLLMFAEAENEINGPTTLAKEALKQVRRRAFATADQGEKVEAFVESLGSKTDFFNALVNERAWEFGGEAVRKYDLVRWNLLGTKIQEQRDGFRKLLNGEAPYNNIPKFLYYKYQSNNEILDKPDINFYTDKGVDPIVGYTRINWMSGYSAANKTTYLEQVNLFSSGLNSVTPNRHLFPIHSSTIAESQGKLKNSYGF